MPEPDKPDLTGYMYVSETPPRRPGDPRRGPRISPGWMVASVWFTFMCIDGPSADVKLTVLLITIVVIVLLLIWREIDRARAANAKKAAQEKAREAATARKQARR